MGAPPTAPFLDGTLAIPLKVSPCQPMAFMDIDSDSCLLMEAPCQDSENMLRIMVSTDNHLGVWEKDAERGDDSFRTFEEVLQMAGKHGADFLLLGGDLFHDNKPSHETMIRTMELMAKYCLGNRPVPFQILSDQTNLVARMANFENPNHNIELPVFIIHGNHDDPTGIGHVSAIDLLSSAAFVNYFGKEKLAGGSETVGNVRLAPILLQKGATKLALYGLGNIRDERLARMFQHPGSVQWVRPEDSPAYPLKDWFNIFVLHQNRVQYTSNAKNTIREEYLAHFLDLVIWGHEHECIPALSATNSVDFQVMQPGSSVATSLNESEAKPKHVVLLDIDGDQFRTSQLLLQTVRPFVFESIKLAHTLDLTVEDPAAITALLEREVHRLIRKARRQRTSESTPKLPLIRLQVDYTGFSSIDVKDFGKKFLDKVANPQGLLLFKKPAARAAAADPDTAPGGLVMPPRPQASDEQRINDIIAQHVSPLKLEVLEQGDMTGALREFVEEGKRGAITDCVSKALRRKRRKMLQEAEEGDVAAPAAHTPPADDAGASAYKQ